MSSLMKTRMSLRASLVQICLRSLRSFSPRSSTLTSSSSTTLMTALSAIHSFLTARLKKTSHLPRNDTARIRARLTDTNVYFLPQHRSVVQIRPVLHPFIFVPPTWVESATTLPSTVHPLLSQSHLPPIHVPEMGKSPSSPR